MKGFRPFGLQSCNHSPVRLKYEEYESLRLINYEMLSHEEAFSSLVLEHLKTQGRIPQQHVRTKTEAYSLKLKNVQEKTYTGTIQNMTIQDSQKIVIKDATIEDLVVVSSDVEIINSTFKGKKERVISSQNSTLSIIASDLFGSIKLDNTRLNLAGITMSSYHKPFEVMKRSTAVFSLCTINEKLIHGKEILEK